MIKYNKYKLYYNISHVIRYVIKPINIINNKFKTTVLIINGGSFIGDDFFDYFISSYIKKYHPTSNIISLSYTRSINFDSIISSAKKKLENLKKFFPIITHVYSHSAGCSITVALTKYFSFPNIILISPYLSWNDKIKSNNKSKIDIILPQSVNHIKKLLKINIIKYLDLSNFTNFTNSNIIIFVGSNEVLFDDTLEFCKANKIDDKNINILDDKIHGFPMWLLESNFDITSLFIL